VARAAIAHGLSASRPPDLDPSSYEPELREAAASFVTLRKRGELRGCTGTLEATQPLVCDVAHNAWRSAFADPRFPPVADDELAELEVSVSVLTAPEPLPAGSEEELLAKLRPGVDGLVLRDGPRRATFLPAVWATLPEPRAFLDALRQKAGLSPGHWARSLRFDRYTTRDVA